MPLDESASEELSEVSSTAYMVATVSPPSPPPPAPEAPGDGKRDPGNKVVQQLVEDFQVSHSRSKRKQRQLKWPNRSQKAKDIGKENLQEIESQTRLQRKCLKSTLEAATGSRTRTREQEAP